MLCASPLLLLAQSDTKNDTLLSDKITAIANAEKVSNSDLEKAYIAFRGGYYYGKMLEFEGCEDFGEMFDKLRLVTGKLQYVSNKELSDASYEELKYFEKETTKFDDENKALFLDKLYYISEGLKNGIEAD